MLKYVTLPYSILIAQLAVIKDGTFNEIKPANSRMIGQRKAAVSKPLDITVLKDKLKSRKISINDYIMSVSCLALSQLCPASE